MDFDLYKKFNAEDFAADDNFMRWVLEEDHSQLFFWKAFLKEYPHKKEDIDLARGILQNTHTYFADRTEEIGKKEMPPELEFAISSQLEKNHKISSLLDPLRSPKKLLKITAACAVLLCGLFLFHKISTADHTNLQYVTGHAEWKTIELPDGSMVELNANSQLSLLQDWSKGKDRTVWLKGEAFFKVKKKPSTQAKFLVRTKDLEVEVLGTSFNVNTRSQKTSVFLEEGKVTLNIDDDIRETMVPGDEVSFSQKNSVLRKNENKGNKGHSNWKNGVFTMRDKSMQEILHEMETIYGLDLIVKDKALNTIEGSLSVPVDNLTIALTILERTLNVKVERYDKQIFISKVNP